MLQPVELIRKPPPGCAPARWETTCVTFCFQNTVGVGRYDVTRGERCPQQLRYQSLYLHDAQRYLSNPKQDAYLL